MERILGLICGAGVLPALMAEQARRQGWRVVAFAFPGAAGLEAHADAIIASRVAELAPVLAGLQAHKVESVVFSGKFWMSDLLRAEAPDGVHARMVAAAGPLVDANMTAVVEATLGSLGITLLDQRAFLGQALAGAGCWSRRRPTEQEWTDVRRGFAVARALADAAVGQTVVVKGGVVSAVEAMEGTSEAIRRGTALSGPGAVVVKSVARAHDFRFDIPTVGTETVEAAAAGGAGVVALEAGRVFLLDREATAARADAAGIALVSTDGVG
ncbi:MAG TPA: UDP-2,3-diacylglucosamine diphosphatase LpxI [Candidatus Limnocylindria bacterium]|nr:UDP-2,3-diacylglucosamine diphosphatase LpxI [Candidatus Limnocylindria bacterium]